MTWAIRVAFPNGKEAFLRQGGVIGSGPIATFYSKEKAEAEAVVIRQQRLIDGVTVIERSHGRQPTATTD